MRSQPPAGLPADTSFLALQALRDELAETAKREDVWRALLKRIDEKIVVTRAEGEVPLFDALELGDIAQEAPVSVSMATSLAKPLVMATFLIIVLFFFILALFLIFINSDAPERTEVRRKIPTNPAVLARRSVVSALGLRKPTFEKVVQDEVSTLWVGFMRQIVPPYLFIEKIGTAALRQEREMQMSRRASWDVASESSEMEMPNELLAASEVWNVRVRQRVLNMAPKPSEVRSLEDTAPDVAVVRVLLRGQLKDIDEKLVEKLPNPALSISSTLLQAFSLREDQQALVAALHAASRAFPPSRWLFKEAVITSLLRSAADSRAIVAELLHDLDECLSIPWTSVSKAIASCQELGEEVVSVIEEKKRLEQMGLLLYLRALSEDPNASRCQTQEWIAATQLLRLLYLEGSKDFRGVLVEIAEAEHILRSLSYAVANKLSLPPEGRATAHCVLDLHAPLAHGLGLDAMVSSSSANERLTPSFEQRALRLYFPDDYNMIEAWMLEEDALLTRTLSRCIREVRRALHADQDVVDLATFEVRGRVKSVYSLVKKLLRQRGKSRLDLKAEAIKDLLALEVVVHPKANAEVPKNPEWLASEWRERAACFAALDALQTYAEQTKGWWILPGSTKDYITKSKKSGYRALHITVGTNVTTLLPKASSRAMLMSRTENTMPCKLEVHIFSASMKQKEQKGLASHNLYKAFELSSNEVFASLAGSGAGRISAGELRRAIFPAEQLCFYGEVFSPLHLDLEFQQIYNSSDHSQDGTMSFGGVQAIQGRVSKKIEDFRRALEKQNEKWWVHGVHAQSPSNSANWSWAKYCAGLDPEDKVVVLDRALAVCKDAHASQVRKSGEPYWTHPLAVADILARMLLPPTPDRLQDVRPDTPEALEEAARALWPGVADGPDDIFSMYTAALLHDTVEDTAMTVSQIEADFGPVVASLVDGVTKASCATRSRASRSAQDLRKVLTRAAQDVRVLIIKFADRLHNLRTLEHMPAKKQRRIAEETRAVYVPLAEQVGVHIWKTELEELCCKYINGYAYQAVILQNELSQVARERNLRYIQHYIRTRTVDMNSDGAIFDIAMTEEPPHTQLRRWADKPGSSLPPSPFPRVKIVTKDREACWACLGRIHSILPPMPMRLRDYISSPKENLYMCLHTTVLMDGAPVEVYINSLQMEWVAEYGVGAYWRYNEELQRSEMGREFNAALHSTWIREANKLRKQSLPSWQEETPRDISAVLGKGDEQMDDGSVGQITDSTEESSDDSASVMLDGDDAAGPWNMNGAKNGNVNGNSVRSNLFSSDASEVSVSEIIPEEERLYAVQPQLERVSRVAAEFAGAGEGTAASPKDSGSEGGDGGDLLAELHRAYSEALREKVAVFTPTGRVLYLPRDATPLDFAVWNLGPRKGLRAEAAVIDSLEAPLHTKLTEGQTILVHLRDSESLPPLEWSGVHVRYLRTTRARAALVEMRRELLSDEQAVEAGRSATQEELTLHSFDLRLLKELGDEVLAALGTGALPVELVGGQLLSSWLRMPLGDASLEYTGKPVPSLVAQDSFAQSFMLVAEDTPGLMAKIVAVVRGCGMDFRRFSAKPCGEGLCIMVSTVTTDCALRFGSVMHNIRCCSKPLLLQRVPAELGTDDVNTWYRDVPIHLLHLPVPTWKREAMTLVKYAQVSPCQAALS